MRSRPRSSNATGRQPAAQPLRHGLIAAAVCIASMSAARADDASLERADALMAQHDAAGAYALLADQEASRAGDPRFDALFGTAALDAGHLTRAIFAFERVLAVRPDDAQVRAELARALLAAGEVDRARTELREARQAEMPEAAAAAIDRVLGAIDEIAPPRGPKTVGYVEIGGGHDSNVNVANNAGEFALPALGGVLFAPDAANRRQADRFGSAAAGISSQFALDPTWSVVGALNGRAVVNERVHALNTGVVDASLGLRRVDGAQAQTVALQSNTAWVSSSVYRTANGASAQWQSLFGRTTQTSVFGQWSRQEYSGQAERNTDRSVLGTGAARTFEPTGTLGYGSVYLAREAVRQNVYAYNGHHAAGLRLGVEQQAGARSVAFAEWQWERRRYGGIEPLFTEGRHEHQSDWLAGVRFTVAPGWQLLPQLRRTAVDSNIALYQYRRTVVQLVLRKDFQ